MQSLLNHSPIARFGNLDANKIHTFVKEDTFSMETMIKEVLTTKENRTVSDIEVEIDHDGFTVFISDECNTVGFEYDIREGEIMEFDGLKQILIKYYEINPTEYEISSIHSDHNDNIWVEIQPI